jgi:hypothetical protein
VHARVVRPPSYNARLTDFADAAVKAMPGVIAVVRDGDFLAVVAEPEFQAVKAMRATAAVAKWQEQPALPDQYDLPAFLEKSVSEVGTVTLVGAESAPGAKTLQAQFTRAYHAWLDRPVERCGHARQRPDDGVDAHAGRLSRPQGDCSDARRAGGEGALHPHRRLRLLRPQRR